MYSRNKSYSKRKKSGFLVALFVILAGIVSVGIYFLFFNNLTIEERIDKYVLYDETISETEKATLEDFIVSSEIELNSNIEVGSSVSDKIVNSNYLTDTFVPVVDVYSVQQKTTKEELKNANIVYESSIDEILIEQISEYIDDSSAEQNTIDLSTTNIDDEQIAIISAEDINTQVKLLSLDGDYYLDSLDLGAFFREITISGDESEKLSEIKFGEALQNGEVYKTNITGVTALTRVMIRKLQEVGNPTYFSEKIGTFLADADLTHVSNEVSFKPGCTFAESSVLSFCSPPEFIETLKASGVDLVELTGNHNNDFGSQYNKETIELYESLGWGTVGGGLNNDDAAKPFLTNEKGSKLAFLAYNYPDSPNGAAISGVDSAGANSFDFAKIESDILAAKQEADFVTVNVQYWECYAYPDGYVEFPECDVPIGEQEENFKKIIDLGADMVVGSSAHQPQTWELYNGKPIYYGLGNLYFDQTSWPGTERGLVLSNYFVNGELIQTKITPTVYGDDLQTRIMTDEEAEYLLNRLNQAR